jgi:apolipoprotein D and lipocalin family protein
MRLLSVLAVTLLGLSACTTFTPSARQLFQPQAVVAALDVSRMEGKWYEIASFPAGFQRDCLAATAEYRLQPDGSLSVVNRCRDRADPSRLREITGSARQVEGGRLRVDLDGVPFGGQFWVLAISPDGKTLVVGTPKRTAGWVLSRENRADPRRLDWAASVFERNGYDVAALQRTRLAR